MSAPPQNSLQDFVFMSGRGFSYFASTPGLSLSLKTVSNGQSHYRFDRREVTIDERGYLILNNKQPYSIEIASATLAETFVLWFPDGWVEEVKTSLTKPNDALLSDNSPGPEAFHFFERYTRHDSSVSPKIVELCRAFKSSKKIDDGWLEERLRRLLAAMVTSQDDLRQQIARMPALRAATREEIWKRVSWARDFLHSHSSRAITLTEAARVACLSPFHFLRSFQSAFGVTPHEYVTQCRIERAKFLLEKTEVPITEVALDAGFVTPSSFSSAFRKAIGVSPRAWRGKRRPSPLQNSKIQKVFLTSRF